MKNYLILLFFCFSFAATAQYYDGGGSIGARNRSMARAAGQQTKSKKQPTQEERLSAIMDKLAEDLKLDSFQAAAIKQLYEENHSDQERILAQNEPDEMKFEKIVELHDKMTAKIKAMLTPEQIEKYETLGQKKKK